MTDEFAGNERIRILREALQLTRDQFSAKTGIGSNQLTNIEQKKQKAYAWHIEQIAQRLPEYALWLTTGKTIPEAGQISPDMERVELKKVVNGTS